MVKEHKKKQETSKSIVLIILILYSVSMAASYALLVFFENVHDISLKIFQATSTLTGSVLIGYFGKAGFENYDKSRNLFKFEKQDETEGGNG